MCQGDSFTFTANTGAGLSYQWRKDGSITGSNTNSLRTFDAGDYTVTVTSSGCSTTSAAKHLTVYTLPAATADTSGSATFCTGDTVEIRANTGSGLSYAWTRNGSVISGANAYAYKAASSGTYRVIVTDARGCKAAAAPVVVTANPYPPATITTTGPTVFCDGSTVELEANKAGGLTYQWRLDGSDIPGATDASLTAAASGVYSVLVTLDHCSTLSAGKQVTVNPRPAPGKQIIHK
jgi:hypothetical protein